MTSAVVEPGAWSAGRWWTSIAFVFVLQVVLLVLLEDRSPPVPRKAATAPAFRLSGPRSAGWLEIEDPTLFALPHRQGFSGQAWLQIPPLQFPTDGGPEPMRYLLLQTPELGARFRTFVETNPVPAFPVIAMLEAELTLPPQLTLTPVSTPSRLRLQGDLARRQLLSKPALSPWPHSDLLTNSVVQLLVDAQGNTFSAVLLPPGSGSTNADQRALQFARTARFKPEPAPPGRNQDPLAGLTIGTMVFEWQTVPVSATNKPSAAP
jgi:hypothetical protein